MKTRNSLSQRHPALTLLSLLTAALALVPAPLPAQNGNEIGFPEDFALVPDRTVALAQLIPGSDEYYYYHCLHYQNTAALDEAERILKSWITEHGETERYMEMRRRQALLEYDRAPENSVRYLQNIFDPELGHQRIVPGQKANLPTKVDPDSITFEAFARKALQHNNLSQVTPEGLPAFIRRDGLDEGDIVDLLNRLERPDYEGLAALVQRDLENPNNRYNFGSRQIHEKLLLSQLNVLRREIPALNSNQRFVDTYLRKLSPPAGVDLELDNGAKGEHLNNLLEFTNSLPPAFNSLKASVLYRKLEFDESVGRYDKGLFLEYLRLPRQVIYMNMDYAQEQMQQSGAAPANLAEDFERLILFPPIIIEEDLVRRYLMHFFVDASGWGEFEQFLKEEYLKEIFAETKLLNGIGEPDQWFPLISPERLQALRDRVDIEFIPANPKQIDRDDIPRLNVWVKNVNTLIVRVYEINTDNYYREHKEELSTSVNLDGLVANLSQTYTYTEPPLRRMKREFQFPELTGPGAWILEFIGNGISSRAVVRKGRLQYLIRNTAAGQEFTVLNERNEKVPNAALWLNGQYFRTDAEDGTMVPYTNTPDQGPQKIVLSEGNFSSLAMYHPEAESYELEADFMVEPQALQAGSTARVVVHPRLSINGQPMSIGLLEKPGLRLTSTAHGIITTQMKYDFELKDDVDAIFDFTVPPGTSHLSYELWGEVKKLSGREPVRLRASSEADYDGLDRTQNVFIPLLTRTPEAGYVLELRGKNGEPLPDYPVSLIFRRHEFNAGVYQRANMGTDENGRIQLGALSGISDFTASPMGQGMIGRTIQLPRNPQWHSLPEHIHMAAGDEILVPFRIHSERPLEDQVSLLELRGGSFTRDWVKAVMPQNGFLRLAELPPGDYSLHIKPEQRTLHVSVAEGRRDLGWVLGRGRHLELGEEAPLQILGATPRENQLEITLANSGPEARVHVIATRYFREYSWPQGRDLPLRQITRRPAEISYESGRVLGDEYRYVIERKYAQKYPGNLLKYPALILNPWELNTTDTNVDDAKKGQDFKGMPTATPTPAQAARERQARQKRSQPAEQVQPSYQFLPRQPVILLNLKPDSNGMVTVPLEQFADTPMVQVVAVDNYSSASWDLVLPPPAEFTPQDLRLKAPFDPLTHRAQTSQITAMQSGRKLLFQDADSTDYQLFDTFERVLDLYHTLNPVGPWEDFSTLLKWPKMTLEEKQAFYSNDDHASHELNFFLYKKDKPFFDSVVKPYLANKKDKTFLDEWLLEADLAPYREMARYERLNIFEQILLAQRFPEMREETARRLTELYEINPTPAERWNMLFETGLGGRALSVGEGAERGSRTDLSEDEGMTFGFFPDSGGGAEPEKKSAAPAEEMLMSLSAAPAAAAAGQGMDNGAAPAAPTFESRRNREMLGDARLEKAMDLREQAAAFYRAPEKTKELAENNYYKRPIGEQDAHLIPLNAFWRDFANYDGNGPFLSENFAEASENFHAIMLALAVLDVPFEAAGHQEDRRETGLEITANGPMIVFRREFAPAEAGPDVNKTVFVSQHFFSVNDKFVNYGENPEYKYLDAGFVKREVYAAHVIVTNSSSATRKLNLLVQIPEGSLPVGGGRATRAVPMNLGPYSTQPLEYYFYFPTAGEFTHYPVQVSQEGKLLAFAPPAKITVLEEPPGEDQNSWSWVSQNAEPDALFAFLDKANIRRLDLASMAWRLQEREFYDRALAYLRERQVYDRTLWGYAFQHQDAPGLREFLEQEQGFVTSLGKRLVSPLLTVLPVEWRLYQHLEYEPLIDARTHRLGNEHKILNDRFYAQYLDYMAVLAYKPELDSTDRLALAGYFFLQERVEEALAAFDQVNPEELPTRLQYDFMAVYVAFYRNQPDAARGIAENYAAYPVPRWREKFADALAQLDEIQGRAPAGSSPDALQPMPQGQDRILEARLDGTDITITYGGLAQCTVSYFLMDVEMLFSRNPFISKGSGLAEGSAGDSAAFSIIRPNQTETVQLPAGQTTHNIAIPEQFRSRNLIIEVADGGIKRTLTYYANRLIVELNENYGRLKVRDAASQNVLPRIYVKVYARLRTGGDPVFYKDGYTDLRGVFDYTSLSTDVIDNVERFALLIFSEDAGAVVKEVAPPQR